MSTTDFSVDSNAIDDILKKHLAEFEATVETEEEGIITEMGDGIARITGLRSAMAGEMLAFANDTFGVALNLKEDEIGAVILGDFKKVRQGDTVRRTGKVVQVPSGECMKGRVVDPLGNPIDGKGPLSPEPEAYRPMEYVAPGVIDRQPVGEPMQTGIKAIDAMIPIGRGQRELIIGDRQSGKTAIAVDTIINQKGGDVTCVYVAIGQKQSTVATVVETLEQHGAMEYTTVVTAPADSSAALQWMAPFSGCAIAEHFLYSGKHTLVIYDDLSKHAQAYRQMSLLLRRPPGREAYPGDVFYLHSRLLERACKLSDELGAGSLTALPIIETQAGDVSAYIPTNVISITDGQIYLQTDLFNAGVRPAIDVGISVSRVGGAAQTKGMKKVAGSLRLDLAQYRELEAFAQFGSDLDKATQDQLNRGARLVEILKQGRYEPAPTEEQIAIIWAATLGHSDDVPVEKIQEFEAEFKQYLRLSEADLMKKFREGDYKLSDEVVAGLESAIANFKKSFIADEG